jgi:hypothetical protein
LLKTFSTVSSSGRNSRKHACPKHRSARLNTPETQYLVTKFSKNLCHRCMFTGAPLRNHYTSRPERRAPTKAAGTLCKPTVMWLCCLSLLWLQVQPLFL